MDVMTSITNTASRSLQGTVYHSDYCYYTNSDSKVIRSWYNGLTSTTSSVVEASTTISIYVDTTFEGAKSYLNVTEGFYGTSTVKFGTGGGQQGRDVKNLTNYYSVKNDNNKSYLVVQRRIMDRHYRRPVQDVTAYIVRPFIKSYIGENEVATVTSVFNKNNEAVKTTITTALLNKTNDFHSFAGSNVWDISNYVVPIESWNSTSWGIKSQSSSATNALYSVANNTHEIGHWEGSGEDSEWIVDGTETDSGFYVPYGITFNALSSNTIHGYSYRSSHWGSTNYFFEKQSTERQTNRYDNKKKRNYYESTGTQVGHGFVTSEEQYTYSVSTTTKLEQNTEIIGE